MQCDIKTASIIGVNMSEPHSNMESGGVVHAQEPWQKQDATLL